MSSRRSKSQSTRASDERFISDVHSQYFTKLGQEKFTESRVLDQTKVSYDILRWFNNTGLVFFISLAFAYNREFMFEFYANMNVINHSTITSRVGGRDVEITKRDFQEFLHLRTSGVSVHEQTSVKGYDWTQINEALRNVRERKHIATVSGLSLAARVIQHVLRTTVLPKRGDRVTISPVLSLATYYIVGNYSFNEADLIIRHVESLLIVRLPQTTRKQNLVLGHIFSYLLFTKYNISSRVAPDAEPSFYSDKNFVQLFGGAKGKRQRAGPAEEDSEEEVDPEAAADEPGAEEEEQAPHYEEGASSSQPSMFDMSSFQAYVDAKFERVEETHQHILEWQARTDEALARTDEALETVRDDVRWIRSHLSGRDHPPPDY